MASPTELEQRIVELERSLSLVRDEAASEQEKARESLRAGEQVVETILDASPDAILLIDTAGTVLRANAAVGRGVGRPAETLVGACVYDLFPKLISDERRRIIAEVVRSGQPIRFEDAHYGRLFDSSVIPILDGAGRVQRLAIYARNVTVQKRTAQAERLEALGALAAGIAHDFRNMLTPIAGLVDLLGRPGLSDEKRTLTLTRMAQAVARASELAGQILSFSRNDERRLVPTDLGDITKEVASLIEASFAGVALTLTIPAGPWQALADPGQVHQAVLNVCVNGAQAVEASGGELKVWLERQVLDPERAPGLGLASGHYVIVHVGDAGPGIGRDVLPRIFDPFFTTKPAGQGTGMGLAIAHGIVRAHGGQIEVETHEGTGSRFSLWFPAYTGDGESIATPA